MRPRSTVQPRWSASAWKAWTAGLGDRQRPGRLGWLPLTQQLGTAIQEPTSKADQEAGRDRLRLAQPGRPGQG
jgi:hypothetical protein